MSQLAYIHPQLSEIYSNAAGDSELEFPKFNIRDQRRYGFRFLKTIQGQNVEYDPTIKSISISLTLIDTRPKTGTVALQIGPGASTAANTTEALQWNSNARAWQDAINALPSVVATYGLATVDLQDGSLIVVFANATAAVEIQTRKNRIAPLSYLAYIAYPVDGEWIHDLRFTVAPFDGTTSWYRQLPLQPTFEPYREGGISGGVATTEMQKLVLPPEFRGTFYIRRSDNLARSSLLDMNDGEEDVQKAVQALFAEEGTIIVWPGENYLLIEFAGDLAGVDLALLEVIVADAPPGDPTVLLDLTRPSIYVALRALSELKCQVVCTGRIVPDGAAADHPGDLLTFFKRDVTITKGDAFEALATVVDPRWLRDPNPIDYTPFDESQVSVSTASWDGPIGNGATNIVDVAHGLGTDRLAVITVRENAAGGRVLQNGVDYTVRVISPDLVRFTFLTVPGVLGLYAAILGVQTINAWNPHLHTIEQVIDLGPKLDLLTSKVLALESKFSTVGIPATSGTTGTSWKLDEVAEVIGYRGTEAVFDDKGNLDVTKLPTRAPIMFPAVHDAVTEALPDPIPNPATNAGKVYQNLSGADVLVVSGGGHRGISVRNNGFVACDGNNLYAATRGGTSVSYYPTAFERTLGAFALSDRMLRVNKTLSWPFGVRIRLVNATVAAWWVLTLEWALIKSETTPAGIGLNLEKLDWNPTPIFQIPISLGNVFQDHFFGVRIKRLADGLKLTQTIYGADEGNDAAAPTSANFALRAKLGQFDTENSIRGERGFPCYQLLGSVEEDDSGNTTIKPSTATIS